MNYFQLDIQLEQKAGLAALLLNALAEAGELSQERSAIWFTHRRDITPDGRSEHSIPQKLIVMLEVEQILEARGERLQQIEVDSGRKTEHVLQSGVNGNLFECLAEVLAGYKDHHKLGLLSYECLKFIEDLPEAPEDSTKPLSCVYLSRQVLQLNCETAELKLQARSKANLERLSEILKAAIARPDFRYSPPQDYTPETYQEELSQTAFENSVRRAKNYIAAGDIFQLILSNSFSLRKPLDALASYCNLLNANPSPYHFYFGHPEFTLLGASPETHLKGQQSGQETWELWTRLVAGTYPKGQSVLDTQTSAQHLKIDTKELAEHLMLVDHSRNDLGKVAQLGSVNVPELFAVETYKDVHHLVSEVRCHLKPSEHPISALKAGFPISTLSGTPKVRALEIIAELEARPRGFFGGTAFYWSPRQEEAESFDSTVIIRSAFSTSGPEPRTSVQAGAGIVFDSLPEREYEECRLKARAVLNSLRFRQQTPI